MKLSEVQVREKVPTIGPAETTSRFLAAEGPAPSWGWDLSFEGGIVTATKGTTQVLIPIGNVAWMRVAVAEAKKGKAA